MTGRFATLIAAVAVLVAMAGPAQAQRSDVPDAKGDVWGAFYPETDFTPAGSVDNADLTRLVVTHSGSAVSAKATYANLEQGVSTPMWLDLSLQTDQHLQYVVEVSSSDQLEGADVQIIAVDEGEVACPQARGAVDLKHDRLSVRVPRACLESPTWVRFRAQAVSYVYKGGSWQDDALTGRAQSRRWSNRLAAG